MDRFTQAVEHYRLTPHFTEAGTLKELAAISAQYEAHGYTLRERSGRDSQDLTFAREAPAPSPAPAPPTDADAYQRGWNDGYAAARDIDPVRSVATLEPAMGTMDGLLNDLRDGRSRTDLEPSPALDALVTAG